MNLSTFIVVLIIITLVVIIIRKMIRDKKRGKSPCGGNCSSCGMCNSCSREEKNHGN